MLSVIEERDLLAQAFRDVCDELGCEYDNEAARVAAHELKQRAMECGPAALRAARAEGIEAAWQAVYAAMANETNASQQRVRKAIRALLTKESGDAESLRAISRDVMDRTTNIRRRLGDDDADR